MQSCRVFQKSINCEGGCIMNNFLGLNVFMLLKDYLFCKANTPPEIYDIDTTMELIIQNRLSVTRFGDGELDMILGINHPKFQKDDIELSHRLKEVLDSNDSNILVCIPNVFKDSLLEKYTGKVARHWKRFLMRNRKSLYGIFKKDHFYGDTQFTRNYIDLNDKTNSMQYFRKIKLIWGVEK